MKFSIEVRKLSFADISIEAPSREAALLFVENQRSERFSDWDFDAVEFETEGPFGLTEDSDVQVTVGPDGWLAR